MRMICSSKWRKSRGRRLVLISRRTGWTSFLSLTATRWRSRGARYRKRGRKNWRSCISRGCFDQQTNDGPGWKRHRRTWPCERIVSVKFRRCKTSESSCKSVGSNSWQTVTQLLISTTSRPHNWWCSRTCQTFLSLPILISKSTRVWIKALALGTVHTFFALWRRPSFARDTSKMKNSASKRSFWSSTWIASKTIAKMKQNEIAKWKYERSKCVKIGSHKPRTIANAASSNALKTERLKTSLSARVSPPRSAQKNTTWKL